MSYCDDCASLLHLGESKESKMFRGFQDNPEGEAPPGPDFTGVPREEEGAPIEG